MLSIIKPVKPVTFVMIAALLLISHTQAQSLLRLLFGLPDPPRRQTNSFFGGSFLDNRQRRPGPSNFNQAPRQKSFFQDILESLDPRRLLSGLISPPSTTTNNNNDGFRPRPFVPDPVPPPRRPPFRPNNNFRPNPFRIESDTNALRLSDIDSEIRLSGEPDVPSNIKVFDSISPDILENTIFRFEKNASAVSSKS